MIKYTKDILVYKVSQKLEVYSEEEIAKIKLISEKVSKEELINIIYKLSELENKIKWSSQKTIIFQTEIIKLCVKQDTKSLEERIEKLEKKISNAKVTNEIEKINNKDVKRIEETAKVKQPKEETKERPQPKVESGNSIKKWDNVLADIKKQGKVILYANLVNTNAVQINDMTIEIQFNSGLSKFRQELLQSSENMNILTKEISMMCGKPMQIKFKDTSATTQTKKVETKKEEIKQSEQQENTEDIVNSLDIPVNFIEE